MTSKIKQIMWFTADYFIDVDRQLVPYIRKEYQIKINWIIIQTIKGARVPQHNDYKILELHHRNKDPRTYIEVANFLKRIDLKNYDLIYSDSLGLMYYTALFNIVRHIPIIHAAHNVNPYPVWPFSLKMEVKYIFNRCQHFQMFSKHTASWFTKHYPKKSFFYAPMSIKDFGKVRTNNFNFDSSKLNLLFFGNVVANKRLDLLINAIKNLPEEVASKVCLNICGKCKEKDHFISRDFTEMTNRLNYLKDIRGIGVFTARPGMGKSYALRCFAASLNPSLFHMEYLCLSTISVADFYKQLCFILGVPEKGGKTGMFKAIQEQITYLYKEKRQPLLLAIDEAQYLNTGILNDIKMLMNYGYDSVNYFTLILCGESHLNDTLRKPVHEALRQRITVHYNYAGLSDDEVSRYILHKLQLAGASTSIIDPAALAAAHSFTQGNPRLIDNLMTDALTISSQQERKVIDAETIRAAVENQGHY